MTHVVARLIARLKITKKTILLWYLMLIIAKWSMRRSGFRWCVVLVAWKWLRAVALAHQGEHRVYLRCPSRVDGVWQGMGVGDAFQCASSENAAGEERGGGMVRTEAIVAICSSRAQPTGISPAKCWTLNACSCGCPFWRTWLITFILRRWTDLMCAVKCTTGCDWGQIERESSGEEWMQSL